MRPPRDVCELKCQAGLRAKGETGQFSPIYRLHLPKSLNRFSGNRKLLLVTDAGAAVGSEFIQSIQNLTTLPDYPVKGTCCAAIITNKNS